MWQKCDKLPYLYTLVAVWSKIATPATPLRHPGVSNF